MISKVLVPLDGSEHSNRALSFAVDLAKKYGASLHLVHVITVPKIPKALKQFVEEEKIPLSPERVYLERVGEKILEAAEGEVKKTGIKEVSKIATSGDPGDKIIATAENIDADVIVMGRRGLGELRGLIAGSVSHKVFTHAPCTVVIVEKGTGKPHRHK